MAPQITLALLQPAINLAVSNLSQNRLIFIYELYKGESQ